jgi:hypothetical protein
MRLSREFSFLSCYSRTTNDGLAPSFCLGAQSAAGTAPNRLLTRPRRHFPDPTPPARQFARRSSYRPAPTRHPVRSRQKTGPGPAHKTLPGMAAHRAHWVEAARHCRRSSVPLPGGWPAAQPVPRRQLRAGKVDKATHWRRRWCNYAHSLARSVRLETMLMVWPCTWQSS